MTNDEFQILRSRRWLFIVLACCSSFSIQITSFAQEPQASLDLPG